MAQTYNIEIELQAKLDEAKRVVDELNNIGNQAETLSKRLSATDAMFDANLAANGDEKALGRINKDLRAAEE